MKIDLSEWPENAEEHPRHRITVRGFMLDGVNISDSQYELAAKALRMMAPDVKELPDSEGWWWQHDEDRWKCTEIALIRGDAVCWDEEDSHAWPAKKGKWVKIQEPANPDSISLPRQS